MNEMIKKINGNVLAIGLDDKLADLLNNNSNIKECILLDVYKKEDKKTTGKKSKNINIKKIKKHFKKKRVDYIICNYNVINKYLNTFIKDSIYINKNKIYFYNVSSNDFLNKYKRYNSIINKNKNYIEIDNSNSYTNIFKDTYYSIIDFIIKAIDLIGDILMG